MEKKSLVKVKSLPYCPSPLYAKVTETGKKIVSFLHSYRYNERITKEEAVLARGHVHTMSARGGGKGVPQKQFQ